MPHSEVAGGALMVMFGRECSEHILCWVRKISALSMCMVFCANWMYRVCINIRLCSSSTKRSIGTDERSMLRATETWSLACVLEQETQRLGKTCTSTHVENFNVTATPLINETMTDKANTRRIKGARGCQKSCLQITPKPKKHNQYK